MELNRRNFLKLGAAAGALAYVGGRAVVSAEELAKGGKSFSTMRAARTAVPTTCFQCPAQCGVIAYVENGRIAKIEGNPAHPNNLGLVCAKGQAGMSQTYDAQRILYPLLQTKERGDKSGFKRISWDEAFAIVGKRIRGLIDAGTPEKVFVMPGRDRSAGYLARFSAAIGTPHQIGRSGTCSQSKKEGFKEIYGYDSGVPEVANSRYILNFGQGVLESASTFVPTAQRVMKAIVENGSKMVTIDPRFSMSAAKSAEWVPIKPGTDLAMALAMHYVIIKEKLYDPNMVKWFNYSLDDYLLHLEKNGYTPEWAEGITGIKAETIVRIAREWATIKPGTVFAYKGTGTHVNGAQTSKAILLLAALVGNLNVKGGFNYSETAKYKAVGAAPPAHGRKKHIATKSSAISPDASTLVVPQIAEAGIVDTYITWVHNPAYVLGDCQRIVDTLKDRSKIPFFVSIDLFMSESSVLSDLILPDVSYLERWDPESHYPVDGVPWVAIRQPVIEPLGGLEQCEILRGIAKAIGPDVYKYFELPRKEYVQEQLNADVLPGFKEWGGYEKLRQVGAYQSPNRTPAAWGYAEKQIKEAELKDAVLNEQTGIYYQPKKDKDGKIEEKDGKPVADTTKIIGIKLADGKVYKGWKTGSLKVQLFSKKWEDAYPGQGLPVWIPSTEAADGELLLFQYKYPTMTHSRTSNNKWLSELCHDNPLLINPVDAQKLGLKDGDRVMVTSKVNAKEASVHVTQGMRPGTVASGWGPGHWEFGAYATAGKSTADANGNDIKQELVKADKDYGKIWWKHNGTNGNWFVELKADPIGGAQEWLTAVKIAKA